MRAMRAEYVSERRCSPSSRLKSIDRVASSKGGANVSGPQSCFTWQSLARIARRYNEANPQDKIVLYRNREQLWKAIKKRLPQCSDEKCWTKAEFLRADDRTELSQDFKPPLPRGKYTWLSTEDIDRVLHGYEKAFPKFKFLGAHPMDFQTYNERFKPLQEIVTACARGIKNIGMVLNLDKSNDPGSHWVALHFECPSKTMEFFDSYGERATKDIMQFYELLRSQGWMYKQNKYQHQFKNSECGVYSIHFIVKRLLGQPFEQTVSDVISDAQMNAYRAEFFDPVETHN
jgi:hypothetical protein